jgi:hypothetical protein
MPRTMYEAAHTDNPPLLFAARPLRSTSYDALEALKKSAHELQNPAITHRRVHMPRKAFQDSPPLSEGDKCQ